MLCLNNNPSISHFAPTLPSCLYNLEYLDFSNTSISDEGLWNFVSSCTNLKALILNNCDHITGSVFQAGFGELIAIDVSRCNNLDNGALYWISQLPKLQRLDISWCKKLAPEAIYEFVTSVLSKDLLQQFWFIGTHINAGALEALEQFSYPIVINPRNCRQIPRTTRLAYSDSAQRSEFLYPPPEV